MGKFRSAWLGWAGLGSWGVYLVNSFGPGFLPPLFQLAALVIGILLFIAYGGIKQFRWFRKNTPATPLQMALIFVLELGVVGIVATELHERFDWLPRTMPTAREVAVEAGGGDNYCFFVADFSRSKPGGGYEWQLRNKKQQPIPNMVVDRFEIISGKEVYRGNWEADTCRPESVDQTTAKEKPIMPGKHIFRFRTINSWEQSLEIIKGPPPQQEGIIYRGGEEIWRFGNVSR